MKPGDPGWISLPNWTSVGPLAIPQAAAERILNERIIPEIGAKGPPPAKPSFILVAGQPGSGKSTTIRQAEMGLQDATQKIIGDDFLAYIPYYGAHAARDPVQAQEDAVHAGIDYFIEAIEKRARDMGANIIQEEADPTDISQQPSSYRRLGYRTELHLLDTPYFESSTGNPSGADHALRKGHIGTNVLVSRGFHDECYAGWARAFFDAERYQQFDRIRLTKDDGTTTYDNHLEMRADGTMDWAKPPEGLDALLRERHRPVTDADAQRVTAAWQSIKLNKDLRFALPDWPIDKHAAEIANFVWSPGSRFDPHSRQPSNSPEAARQWENFVKADLDLTRSSRSRQIGDSEEFDDSLRQYGHTVIGSARNAIYVASPARQHAGVPQPVPSNDPQPAQPNPRKRTFLGSLRPLFGQTAEQQTSEPPPAAKRPRLDDRNDHGRGDPVGL